MIRSLTTPYIHILFAHLPCIVSLVDPVLLRQKKPRREQIEQKVKLLYQYHSLDVPFVTQMSGVILSPRGICGINNRSHLLQFNDGYIHLS